jgi:hypothetical protein
LRPLINRKKLRGGTGVRRSRNLRALKAMSKGWP